MTELTRLLYSKEEVIHSLVSSLLKKRDLLECYFWAFELHHSRINVFDVIWEIYYDYYAVLNPKFEKYIASKQSQWEAENDEEHLCYVIRNTFSLVHCYTVYMVRQSYLNGCDVLVVTKATNDMKAYLVKYEKKWHNLLVSINKHKLNNVCYYLSSLMETTNHFEVLKTVCTFIADTLRLDTDDEAKFNKVIKTLWERKRYANDLHYMLAVICQLYVDDDKINTKSIYIAPEDEDIKFAKETKNITEIRLPRRLREKCKFGVDKNIGCIGTLQRFRMKNYVQEIKNHWKYYAFRNAYWKNILKNVTVDDDEREISFMNEDDEELFYQTYGYDMDEEPKSTQENIGLFEMEKKDSHWVEYVYEEKPDVAGLIV